MHAEACVDAFELLGARDCRTGARDRRRNVDHARHAGGARTRQNLGCVVAEVRVRVDQAASAAASMRGWTCGAAIPAVASAARIAFLS